MEFASTETLVRLHGLSQPTEVGFAPVEAVLTATLMFAILTKIERIESIRIRCHDSREATHLDRTSFGKWRSLNSHRV